MKKKYLIMVILLCLLFTLGILSGCNNEEAIDPRELEIRPLITSNQFDKAREKTKELFANDEIRLKELMAHISDIEEIVRKDNKAINNIVENWDDTDSTQNKSQKYMEENNIKLTAKDVQYDMANNLNKEFAISGNAELDDYYNYGFDDDMEDDYFVASVRPEGGSYSEEWYLYFHRESFKELFTKLKKVKVNIIATAEIPDYRFKKGQGNMAIVKQASW